MKKLATLTAAALAATTFAANAADSVTTLSIKTEVLPAPAGGPAVLGGFFGALSDVTDDSDNYCSQALNDNTFKTDFDWGDIVAANVFFEDDACPSGNNSYWLTLAVTNPDDLTEVLFDGIAEFEGVPEGRFTFCLAPFIGTSSSEMSDQSFPWGARVIRVFRQQCGDDHSGPADRLEGELGTVNMHVNF
jgi:hypothetical protein